MIRQWRAPVIFCGLVVVGLSIFAASRASADPNVETHLPADGVESIEQTSPGIWTATFDGIPSEFKVVSNPQFMVCGVNYGIQCALSVTFTWAHGDCLYAQTDGIPGHNSSDAYVCWPIVATSTPTPSATPTATPTPTEEPTWTATPTATPSTSPTSVPPAPQPTATTTVSAPPISQSSPKPNVSSIPRLPQAPRATQTAVVAAPHELARTGFGDDPNKTWPLIAAICGFGLFLIVAAWTARMWRARPRYKRGGTKSLGNEMETA